MSTRQILSRVIHSSGLSTRKVVDTRIRVSSGSVVSPRIKIQRRAGQSRKLARVTLRRSLRPSTNSTRDPARGHVRRGNVREERRWRSAGRSLVRWNHQNSRRFNGSGSPRDSPRKEHSASSLQSSISFRAPGLVGKSNGRRFDKTGSAGM